MLLILIRAVFVLVVAGLGVRIARIVGENDLANPYLVFIGVMVARDRRRRRRPADPAEADPDDLGHLLRRDRRDLSSAT